MTQGNDQVRQMSQLLLQGATMLKESCPNCQVPLFKLKDQIFCPSCKKKVIFAKSDTEAEQIQTASSNELIIQQLEAHLYGKIELYSQDLMISEKLSDINQILHVIDRILSVLLKIKTLYS
ncbi:MAG: Sjogren's syndrome/scleroderma autoantigen 1 family protein [Candidatus Hermodarchaeota archaeon]